MPITVKTIQRINPRRPEDEGKYYIQVVQQEKTDLNSLCRKYHKGSLIVLANMKILLLHLEHWLIQELSEGHPVDLDELGSFSISLHSNGTTDAKKAKPKNIKSAKIIYRPGKKIKNMLKKLEYVKE